MRDVPSGVSGAGVGLRWARRRRARLPPRSLLPRLRRRRERTASARRRRPLRRSSAWRSAARPRPRASTWRRRARWARPGARSAPRRSSRASSSSCRAASSTARSTWARPARRSRPGRWWACATSCTGSPAAPTSSTPAAASPSSCGAWGTATRARTTSETCTPLPSARWATCRGRCRPPWWGCARAVAGASSCRRSWAGRATRFARAPRPSAPSGALRSTAMSRSSSRPRWSPSTRRARTRPLARSPRPSR
eukprot:PRCOL_00007019-RA